MQQAEITDLEITLTRPAPALDGFRVCHLSDLHTTRIHAYERNLMRVLSEIEADVTVFTGDFTNGSNELGACVEILSAVRSRLGVFSVFGNNEHNRGVDLDLTTHILKRNNIQVLRNSHYFLKDPGVWIVGVDDPFQEHDDIYKAIRNMSGDGPRILLAHSVEVMPRAVEAKMDLVLAGHTHGGQVNLPGRRAIWGHSRYGTKLVAGYFTPQRLQKRGLPQAENTHLYVSRGLGTSLLPIRIWCPPEIAIITLRSPR